VAFMMHMETYEIEVIWFTVGAHTF
jgi:hypothetical protein